MTQPLEINDLMGVYEPAVVEIELPEGFVPQFCWGWDNKGSVLYVSGPKHADDYDRHLIGKHYSDVRIVVEYQTSGGSYEQVPTQYERDATAIRACLDKYGPTVASKAAEWLAAPKRIRMSRLSPKAQDCLTRLGGILGYFLDGSKGYEVPVEELDYSTCRHDGDRLMLWHGAYADRVRAFEPLWERFRTITRPPQEALYGADPAPDFANMNWFALAGAAYWAGMKTLQWPDVTSRWFELALDTYETEQRVKMPSSPKIVALAGPEPRHGDGMEDTPEAIAAWRRGE